MTKPPDSIQSEEMKQASLILRKQLATANNIIARLTKELHSAKDEIAELETKLAQAVTCSTCHDKRTDCFRDCRRLTDRHSTNTSPYDLSSRVTKRSNNPYDAGAHAK